ncbi:MAG: dihydroorotate dehydrogenase-like protein [Anaerolineales bacterium]|nr:dihydroorotate dehydrogenase-like protein [Anaerolineales bacterium]
MADLQTSYLGMTLRNPLVPSASPLAEHIDTIKQMEDAGAGAVVLHSLFEEQLTLEALELDHHMTFGTDSFAEALSYFPEPDTFRLGPDAYLDHIRKAKEAVDIPIIASLNGSSTGGWTNFAWLMEQAGADALELNLYAIPTDADLTGAEVEERYLQVVRNVKAKVSIPVAVKVGPYFSNMANMAKRFSEAGADGLVLFNRFYQPDIDLDELRVVPNILLSTSYDLRLPLRWIAILYGRTSLSLAATSGIHELQDVIKVLMVGANVTMMAAALFHHGVDYLRTMESGLQEWLETNEYVSVKQMQGSMSQIHVDNPSAFERAQYMRALATYQLPKDRISGFFDNE